MKRIIARLDIKGENVVRGLHLEGLRVVGRPEQLAQKYATTGADEIIFIDTVASLYGRNNIVDVVERTAKEVFIPMTVGGGVRSLKDVDALLRAGADKVTLNSAAVKQPALVTEIAKYFGSQCVVAAIEAKKDQSGWKVMIENGRESTGLDVIVWAKELQNLGAGEILITSIDQDGTRKGFDLNLISEISKVIQIPLIASGGAGTSEHLFEGFHQCDADAAALGAILHFNHATIPEIKSHLHERGVEVRIT